MVSYGVRVQKSVFEVEADRKTVDELRRKIKRVMDEEDFVVYFDVCERDWQKKLKYGPQEYEENEEKEFYIL